MIEWKDDQLGSVLKIKYGKDHKALEGGNIPCIGSGGIMRYVNDFLYDKVSILIPRKGSLNNIIYQDKPFWTVDTMFWSIINEEKVIPKFLFYQLTLIDYTNLNVGSAVPSLTVPVINEIDISLPAKDEQYKIAEILSSLDDKIDLLHRQNQTLEQMAETLFRQWFVEEADEGWEDGVLGDEFDFTMGQSPPGSSFNEDGIGTPMYQGNRDFGFRFPENRVFTTEPKRFAEKYDTLISVRAPVGEQNMANEKCCIGRGVAAFRYKANPAYFTYTFFKMKSLMDEIKQFNETGTVFGSISKNDFQEMEVIIPPIKMVEKFQSKVKPIDDKIISNCNQIRTLTALRDTLLPKLMSGEVRVEMDSTAKMEKA
jgi:type I restriction enzyme S subunit